MDPLTTGVIALGLGLAWDYGRRTLALRSQSREAAALYEAAYQKLREAMRAESGLLSDARLRLMNLENEHTSSEGIKAQFIGIQRSVNEAVEGARTANKELDGIALAIKSLGERCDKNSTAIVNTAESMQKLLNEKFTAVALQRGLNQGRAG